MDFKQTPLYRKMEAAQAEVKRLWALACEDEGIPVNSSFIVLTSVNRYAVEYNEAVKAFFEARKNWLAAEKKNRARRNRHAVLTSMGLKRVTGALGGVYYE